MSRFLGNVAQRLRSHLGGGLSEVVITKSRSLIP